ncbi:MAG TPA: VWA domain-containing protein [Candidatus Angelobacter sp.]|nr:VWA domain-containing protein [Candidatus Angelobacter sp.]
MLWLVRAIKVTCPVLAAGILFFPANACLAQSNDYQPLPGASVVIHSQQEKRAVQGSDAQGQTSEANQQNTRPGYSMRLEVPLVTLDVSVLNPDGYFVNDLNKENFRVLEDGVPQEVTSLAQSRAPVSAVLLVEYSAETFGLQLGALRSCFYFMRTLTPDDWTAVVLFDKRPRMVQDFTQDRTALQNTLNTMAMPLSREVNLFDALYDTVDRLQSVEGRKYVILLASGVDTFSRRILDEVYRKIQSAKGIAIYTIETDRNSEHRQETNQMRSFAQMSGGQFFFATSPQEFADVFRTIGQSIRNHYILTYRPSHTASDGAWHKIKVEVVTTSGHKKSYQVVARDGYRAKTKAD